MNSNANLLDSLLQNRVLTHVLFWMFMVAFLCLLASLNDGAVFVHFVKYLSLLPAQLLATYSFVYYLVPEYLLQKRYGLFFLLLLVSYYVFTAIARLSIIYLAEPFFRVDFRQETVGQVLADPVYLLAVYVPAVYMVVLIFFALKSIKGRFEAKHHTELLQKEKLSNELRFLKAQIHPHFLFNTLNNIYSLTLEQSTKAPEAVLKLSELLDYMLYQCEEPEVPLEKEVDLLHNYIELERLRYGEKLNLTFQQAIDEPDVRIAPLILLTIVENAFKHGVSDNLRKSTIALDLLLKEGQLSFKVANSKANAVNTKREHHGIGTANIQRQLDLVYPNKHRLIIDDKPDTYTLTLEIDLL